ncbi:UDP-Glycosyltransferase/glycogen phosphorylase [Auricularia subglabra TFB-10046 SS5]|nr:UDP-Glycosyltransferase/glycogen phosphorylase [Auricularia subglabra TFB-10046 SS5]
MSSQKLRVAFVHPDLGIGGAERLVVDVAVGLQKLGHSVDIYTSYHDPKHSFEETRDGTLKVHIRRSLLPRSIFGRFHVLLAHLAQLQLTFRLVAGNGVHDYDVFFVDQLATCIPLLRDAGKRVVFYCHFPDKLLAAGEYVDDDGQAHNNKVGWLKRLYRLPMDWLEEVMTGQADVLLANSQFTCRVFNRHFPNIPRTPRVVYPGIDGAAYAPLSDSELASDEVRRVLSNKPTLLSINRIEGKKNLALAVRAFAGVRATGEFDSLRLVIAGGHDPRLADNRNTLDSLLSLCSSLNLSAAVLASDASNADVVFVLNFSGMQRRALLNAPSTRALLYTPTNEHFGIGPVEGMRAGLPVLACRSGGPMESVHDPDPLARDPAATGFLRAPIDGEWTRALLEILRMPDSERKALGGRARKRAEELFGPETMAKGVEDALKEAMAMGPLPARNAHELVWVALLMLFAAGISIFATFMERVYITPHAPLRS